MEGDEDAAASAAAAAAARIRVVRCPRCDKFLPELPAYSVYVCGGCGAALQAKKKYSTQASDNSDNGHVKYLEVLDSVPEASEAMPEARNDDRSLPNRTSALHSRSVYNHEDNRIPRGPSTSTGEATIRKDGRVAKYMRIRNGDNVDRVKSVRARGLSDISPRSPIDGIPPASYQGEGLVDNTRLRYRYSNREHANDRDLDGPSRVRGLEKDRAELLRMLDELRDQVQQSCEITDAPSRSATVNRSADASSSYGTYDQPSQLRHDSSVLHRNGSHYSPYLNLQSPNIPQVHAPLPTRQNLHGYAEPIPNARASSYPAGSGYQCRNFDNFFFGHHDPDPLLSYHHESLYHQPVCSCLNNHREFLPVQGTPLGFSDQRAPYLMNSYGAYPVDGPLFGQQRYNSRGTNTSMQRNHLRTNVTKKPAQTCEPIAGGAPFTICYNCYEVLQIPMKHSTCGKEYKLRCGSCSHAIVVQLDGSRLNVSELLPGTHLSAALQNGIGDSRRNNVHANADESLLPQYCFSVGSPGSQEKDLESNSSESDSKHTPLGTDYENTPQSKDLPPEVDVVSHIPNLPQHDHCGFSQKSEDSGMGSRSTHSEHEKAILLTESCKRNSIKDVCVANETHSPDSELDDPVYAQDTLNLPPNDGPARATKAGDSFLTNLIKRSFKINHGTRNGRARVFVNGFPVSDRAVWKAEKLAGAICPGDYWYDYRAGFWGVMGRPCLGMIPPYIPEFNYPMPRHCAGGNTGIFINGRELHQKDLDLLVSRGLSDSPGRSYIVEISGKVSDEVSGEELYGLGKLAPTVEKMRRGFGMRVPRIIQ